MPITKRTRYEVLKRDNHTCRYCGGTAPDVKLTVDHVTPVALGGSDDPGNLVAACQDCNYGKASTSPDAEMVEDVRQADLKWSSAVRRAGEILSADDQPRADYVAAFFGAWPAYRSVPDDAASSVRRLYDSGLPVETMRDAVLIATSTRGVHDRFSYFMGVCWKRVREIQEVAKQILTTEES